MDKLAKLWFTRLAGTAVTAIVATSTITYFSNRDNDRNNKLEQRLISKTNCEQKIEEKWNQYKKICEPFPDSQDKLETFYLDSKKELRELGCDTKCLEWTCIIEQPKGEYKAKERTYCLMPLKD